MFYVKLEQKINGRYDFYKLVDLLQKHGYEDGVEYYPGDELCPPHLQFIDEGDAVAYCLTTGSIYSASLPRH
jgi:hypothetical protein